MRYIACFLVVLVLCGTAWSAEAPDLTVAVDGFVVAVAAELVTLDGMPDEKATLKARKMLAKAMDFAGRFDGTTGKKSMKGVTKALAFAAKAGHDSAELYAAFSEVRVALEGVIDSAKDEVTLAKGRLEELKNQVKVETRIAKAIGAYDKARDVWSEKFHSAAKSFVKSLFAYEKALSIAENLRDKELLNGGLPFGLRINKNGKLINESGETIEIEDVVYKLTVSALGFSETIKARASLTNFSGSFPLPLGLEPFDPTEYNSTLESMMDLGLKIKGTITYETSVGDFAVKWDFD